MVCLLTLASPQKRQPRHTGSKIMRILKLALLRVLGSLLAEEPAQEIVPEGER